MQQYEILLKNEKIKPYKRSLLVIIALNIIAFTYIAYHIHDPVQKKISLAAAISIAFVLLINFKLKKYKQVDLPSVAILLIVLFYYKLGMLTFAIGVALIFLFYLLAIKKPVVRISATAILFPAFFTRKILWSELSNVILKDGILTIDFKNNKILQAETEGDDLADEKEFNDFCIQHLNKR